MKERDHDHDTPELGSLPERLYGAWWPEGEVPPVSWDALDMGDRDRFVEATRVITGSVGDER